MTNSPSASAANWQPYRYLRSIGFGDTDAAGMAYTGRLSNILLEAIEGWYRDRLQTDWFHMTQDLGMGTPFVKLGLEFQSPVTPREAIAIEVLAVRVGRSSTSFAARATGVETGVLCFTGEATNVFVSTSSLSSIEIPEPFNSAIRHEVAMAEALLAGR